jgi:hypothetical protein
MAREEEPLPEWAVEKSVADVFWGTVPLHSLIGFIVTSLMLLVWGGAMLWRGSQERRARRKKGSRARQ